MTLQSLSLVNRPKSVSGFFGVHAQTSVFLLIGTNCAKGYLAIVQTQPLRLKSNFFVTTSPMTPPHVPLKLYGPDFGDVPQSLFWYVIMFAVPVTVVELLTVYNLLESRSWTIKVLNQLLKGFIAKHPRSL